MRRADAPAPPHADPELVAALRQDLCSAAYTSEHVEELLGEVAAAALRRDQTVPARRVLRGLDNPAAVLLGLFTLGQRPHRAQLDAALPTLGAEGAAALGLVRLGDAEDRVTACVDLAPYSATDDLGDVTWWIASDRSELATGTALHPDHVLGVGGASLTLARITPRRRVDRALDLGCGCGIQALHAARHAREVVATDLSARALAFTAFNAALNEVHLDLRQGSLLDPVAGERFDLIVSNPPFVITPRGAGIDAWTYRDGGQAGDRLLAELVRDIPGHLRTGGTAVMLADWEIPADEPWDAHPRAWLAEAAPRCSPDVLDAWVIQRECEDTAQYAETWARDGGVIERDDRWEPMIDAWLEDFASRGTGAVGFGYLFLRRRLGPAAPVHLCEDVPTTGSGGLAAHLAQGLDALGDLAALTDAQLLSMHPVRADDVIERRHLTPGAWDPRLIELVQGAGLGRVVPADSLVAAVVGACDGQLSLDQILGAVCALTETDPQQAREQTLPSLRELLRTGLLTLPEFAPLPDPAPESA